MSNPQSTVKWVRSFVLAITVFTLIGLVYTSGTFIKALASGMVEYRSEEGTRVYASRIASPGDYGHRMEILRTEAFLFGTAAVLVFWCYRRLN